MAFLDIPNPLVEAPSLAVWQRFSGLDYLVFVDESFFQFFDFSHHEGNFCHGAVGIPAVEYDAFKVRFQSTVLQYREVVSLTLGKSTNEIKHSDLYKLPYAFRRKFALRLNGDLIAHGGFIGGFYTSNRGFVMEKIREDLVDEQTAIPTDYTSLFGAKVTELNAQRDGPGQSALISRLLKVPIAGITNFLSSFGCQFTMMYDPRQHEEDQAVKSQAEDYMSLLSRPDIRDLLDVSTGGSVLDITRRSEDEIGLQIADFVAGEVRRFFRFNSELLKWGSDLTLVSGESEDELESPMLMSGVAMKAGRFIRIPVRLQRQYFKANDNFLLPFLRNAIMSGSLCCVTDFGQERIVRLFQGLLFDLCD